MSLATRLHDYVAACFTGLWIHTNEPDEAEREIVRLAAEHKWKWAAWDIASGLRLQGQVADTAVGDPLAVLKAMCGEDECNCAEPPCLLVFDVRDLSNFREDDHPPFLVGAANNRANRRAWKKYQANGGEDAHFRRVIMEAIERKLFVPGVPIGPAKAQSPKEDHS